MDNQPNPAIAQLQACLEKYLRMHRILVECGIVFEKPPLPGYDPETISSGTADEVTIGDLCLRLALSQNDLENPERRKQHFENPEPFAWVLLNVTRGNKQVDDIMFDPTTGWLPDPLHGYGKGSSRAERFLVAIVDEKEVPPLTDEEAEKMIRKIARDFLTATAKNLPRRRPFRICFVSPSSALWPSFFAFAVLTSPSAASFLRSAAHSRPRSRSRAPWRPRRPSDRRARTRRAARRPRCRPRPRPGSGGWRDP